jgi:hypothetical protein
MAAALHVIAPGKGALNPMQRTTIKRTLLALILASALPLAACSDDDTPTSPTQPGPPVSETPPPTTSPEPTPPSTPPPAPPTDDRPVETITGVIANLTRSGEGGLDTSFRIDDRTVARVAAGTPVISGSQTGDTNFLREGQTVTVEGRRSNGFLDATRVEIIQQAP